MAWTNLIDKVLDDPFGFQTFNQLKDNILFVRDHAIAVLTNSTGAQRVAGDVVVQDTAVNTSFVLPDAANSVRKVFVVLETIAAAAAGNVGIAGYIASVKVNGTVTRGQYLFTQNANVEAVSGAVASGAFGIALTAAAGPGSGTVSAVLFHNAGFGNTTRYVQFEESAIIVSGAPASDTFDNVTVLQLPNGADSEINVWFRVPPDAVVSADILLMLSFAPNTAPGATNNKVKLKTTAKVNNTAAAQTAGDTITLANDTNWASYTATVNKIAASTYVAGDLIQVKILRDTTVANNAAVLFNISKIAFRYTSSQ